jgi:hypothetical protein
VQWSNPYSMFGTSSVTANGIRCGVTVNFSVSSHENGYCKFVQFLFFFSCFLISLTYVRFGCSGGNFTGNPFRCKENANGETNRVRGNRICSQKCNLFSLFSVFPPFYLVIFRAMSQLSTPLFVLRGTFMLCHSWAINISYSAISFDAVGKM